MSEFRAGLSAREAHARLSQALIALREAERNAVLWFAEILQRRLYRELGYSSIHLYAAEALGFSPSKTSQFIGLAESLERLPALRQSVATGELPWTKAREVAKVATPRSEGAWIRFAKQSGRRELEGKIASARARAAAARKPAQPLLLDEAVHAVRSAASLAAPPAIAPVALFAIAPVAPSAARPASDPVVAELPVILGFRLSPEQAAHYEALVERLHKLRARRSAPSRGQTREEILLEAFAALVEIEEAQATDPEGDKAGRHSAAEFTRVKNPAQIVVYHCDTCKQGTLRMRQGERAVKPATMDRLLCDARIQGLGKINRATIPPATRRTVLARDGYRCRMKSCGGTRFLEVHHIVPRGRGGSNKPDNLLTLCTRCHQLLHEKGASVSGFASLFKKCDASSAPR
jgi:hypothetical protein